MRLPEICLLIPREERLCMIQKQVSVFVRMSDLELMMLDGKWKGSESPSQTPILECQSTTNDRHEEFAGDGQEGRWIDYEDSRRDSSKDRRWWWRRKGQLSSMFQKNKGLLLAKYDIDKVLRNGWRSPTPPWCIESDLGERDLLSSGGIELASVGTCCFEEKVWRHLWSYQVS